ncbi:response regulator transcription factor [Vibrio hyugaensis]|uniref:DNA-binding response regulator n=1 Tax=Vibrio hyugaensis TaxID=1534743 RepID=A0ABQ5YA96_9VIBR|nr:response regulator transcription factor [Vibrio hyugaensis]GLR06568.1 DNA-binding response regulator [Vibrio hyugaensis]
MKEITCLVVDDHPLVCSAIKNILLDCEQINDIVITNTFRDGLDIIKNRQIGLLLLDINLSDGDGFDFLKRARAYGYDNKVIFMSAECQKVYKQLAFRAGADAYISKVESNEVFSDTVKLVSKGYTFFKFDSDTSTQEPPSLSNRESAVLRLLLKGYSNRKISELLSISDKTVSTYKSRILVKFNVGNILELNQVAGSVNNK